MLIHPKWIIPCKLQIRLYNLSPIYWRSTQRVNLCHCENICWGMSNYYAVAKGRKPGVYNTWSACQEQVLKFSGGVYKKFNTIKEAEEFIKNYHSVAQKSSLKNVSLSLQIPEEVFPLGKKRSKVGVKNNCIVSKRTLSSESESDTLSTGDSKRRKINTDVSQNSISIKDVKFTVDNEGYVEVYTDGACSANGASSASAGIGVWFGEDHPSNISQSVIGRPTNNNAEIQAVTAAVREAKRVGIKKLKINTDSTFVINCITKWMKTWKRKGWMTSAGKPVINKVELQELEEALTSIDVSWNHVRGHVGIHGNEMADKLARNGCAAYVQANK